MQTIINIQNLNKLFGDHKAVDNLNLQVEQGEIYGFLGPNGSGKSTTLRMILGLLKPTSGSIEILGKSLHNNRADIMKQLGCIIEKPDFYNYLSGLENLKQFARMYDIKTNKYDFKSLLEKVGLYGREKDLFKTYSHGMKQRLGLAQALLHNPSIIILDEPNTGLDPQGIIELRETIVNLNKNEGKTILLSSHILNEVEAIAKSMILINKGKTVAQGKIAQLLSHEDLIVNIEVGQVEEAKLILDSNSYASKIKSIEQNQIHLNLSNAEIPIITKLLTINNIDIYNIAKTRSLENYFLKLTA